MAPSAAEPDRVASSGATGEVDRPGELADDALVSGLDLTAGDLEPEGVVPWASNATALAYVCAFDGSRMPVIYKPTRGERPLWDFPRASLATREVAASVVSSALGWEIVPPTVYRDGPLGPGSVQAFCEHDPERHYFELAGEARHAATLRRIALFDLVVNNADRKGGHILERTVDGRLFGIDHGLCFNVVDKLRTVVWDFAGAPVSEADRADLRRLADRLADPSDPLIGELGGLLNAEELTALAVRAAEVADLETLPEPPEDRFPYPWPPV